MKRIRITTEVDVNEDDTDAIRRIIKAGADTAAHIAKLSLTTKLPITDQVPSFKVVEEVTDVHQSGIAYDRQNEAPPE